MNNKKIDLLCKWGTIISAFIFVLSIPLSVYFYNKDDVVETDIFDDIDEEVDEVDEEIEEEPTDDVQYFIEEPTEENPEEVNPEEINPEEPVDNIEEPNLEETPVEEPTE